MVLPITTILTIDINDPGACILHGTIVSLGLSSVVAEHSPTLDAAGKVVGKGGTTAAATASSIANVQLLMPRVQMNQLANKVAGTQVILSYEGPLLRNAKFL